MIKTDLHIHSCLSPCGSEEMDPFDLVGMAKVSGIDLIALTDHNSARNCPAAAQAAESYGIVF
ncbi:MAG: PHP domain-containing protein, partial [Anaerovoracaceae bacterium]